MFFSLCEKLPNLIFTKKISKNRRHPYAHFGVEIMLISSYLAKLWSKNHLKSRDLEKIRYNALRRRDVIMQPQQNASTTSRRHLSSSSKMCTSTAAVLWGVSSASNNRRREGREPRAASAVAAGDPPTGEAGR